MSRKLTIGYILDDTLDVSDGVQQAVLLIGETMRERGHDVHYITSTTERTDLRNVHVVADSIALKFNGNSVRTPRPASKKIIQRLFGDVKFDVLHVQAPYSPVLAARVIRLAPESAKIISTFHILPYSWISRIGTRLLSALLKSSLKKIDQAYAVSGPALKFMQQSFKLDGEVLPNPVRYKFFANAKKQNVKNERPKIIYVGRFDERKGVVQLAKGYKILTQKGLDVELTMCGKGSLWQEINEYSRKNKLKIKLPGFVSEETKADLLASADIAIFPSLSGESFGIVLTEAMSAGAGVTLGGNNPGYTSVLTQWPETLFDAKSPENIADILEKFIQDDKLLLSIGSKQHEAVKQYDISKIADKLESAYYS